MEVNREIAKYVDVMIGNEEDFTAALGFKVEGLDEHIIAVANWSKVDQPCSLAIEWYNQENEKSEWNYMIPAIPGYQEKLSPASLNELIIPGRKGFLIVIKKNDR